MNPTDFKIRNSTVVSTEQTNSGRVIWTRYESGQEAAYAVEDPNFHAREGQQITAIHFCVHPVAIRNDHARTKIQLLSGEDLLGSGPDKSSRPAIFWFAWLIFIAFLCPCLIEVGQSVILEAFGNNAFVKWVSDIVAVSVYAGAVFGVPYFFIILPALRRFKHRRRIKAADRVITNLYNEL